MKNVKIIFSMAAVFILSTNTIIAQQKKTMSKEQKEVVQEQSKKNEELLALTEEQKIKYKEITKKYNGKLKALKDSDANKMEKRKTIKKLEDDKNSELKSILSASQFNTYLEIKAERKSQTKNQKKQQPAKEVIE